MTIGGYDKRVTIQQRSGEPDELGTVAPIWVDRAQRWGSLADTSGSELYRAQKVDPQVSAVITLRERYTGLASDDRLVVGSRTFHIKSVLGGSDRVVKRGQVCACAEVF